MSSSVLEIHFQRTEILSVRMSENWGQIEPIQTKSKWAGSFY